MKLPLLIPSSALTLEGLEMHHQPVSVPSRDSISLYIRTISFAELNNSRSSRYYFGAEGPFVYSIDF